MGDGWGADPVLLSCSASRGISSGVFPDRAIWEPFSARLTRLTLSWKLIRVRLRTVSLVEVQQNRRFGTSRRTSASFPEKGRSETPDRVRRPPGNMASGRVWRAKPAILLHTATPKSCVGPARPRTRSSARLGRASVRPGLASESGRGRPSNQPSNSTACGNYLHVSLFFGNFAIMTDRVHVLRVFHTCAPVAEYTRKRG